MSTVTKNLTTGERLIGINFDCPSELPIDVVGFHAATGINAISDIPFQPDENTTDIEERFLKHLSYKELSRQFFESAVVWAQKAATI